MSESYAKLKAQKDRIVAKRTREEIKAMFSAFREIERLGWIRVAEILGRKNHKAPECKFLGCTRRTRNKSGLCFQHSFTPDGSVRR